MDSPEPAAFGSGPAGFGSGPDPFGSGASGLGSGPDPFGSGASGLGSGPDPFGSGASGFGSEPVAFTSAPPASASVAPPGFTPAPAPAVPGPMAAAIPAPGMHALARSTAADAALRWRLRAATIDNLLVYSAYISVCVIARWSPLAPSHWLVLGALSVVYHFAFEATSGQTIGKARVGIQVVSVDGGLADAKAIALRSVLRIIDQLPVWYASGLVSMLRTGPERRQRIGDVAGRTMVVAIDGRAARRGTPGWYLPSATLVATALSVVVLINLHSGISFMGIQLSSGGNEALTAQQQAQFIAGCQATGGPAAPCGCVLTQLEADGYDSMNSMRSLLTQIQTAVADHNANELPPEMLKAARVCGV
jgi:uncharacterized RDD family membrane protein YckC